MAFTYAEEKEQVVMPDMGKRCPFGNVARFCYQGECELWVDGHCAFTVMAIAMAKQQGEG
jgi:hypothetical protein